jgi:hypothetical protein
VTSEWVSLQEASRITGRPCSTIKGWRASGKFSRDEWRVKTEVRMGTGHPIHVRLDALEREHRAHGGNKWHPDMRDPGVPPSAQTQPCIARESEEVVGQEAYKSGREYLLSEAMFFPFHEVA